MLLGGWLALLACRGAPPPAEPVVIALAQNVSPALVHVAVAQGYFASEGVAAVIQRHEFGKLALESLLAGEADLATCADVPFVLARLRGASPVFVATLSSSSQINAVLARRDHGISVPADLAGKRVGVPFGTSGAFFLDVFLVRNRIERARVSQVDLRPEEMLGALLTGEVDAVVIWDPVRGRIVNRFGDGVASFQAEDVYWETFGLAAMPDLVGRRPGLVEKVLRALLRAEVFARDHPGDAKAMVAAAVGTSSAEMDAAWGLYQFRVGLDEGLVRILEQQARWAKRTGLVPPQPAQDYSAAILREPLLTVKPAAVQLMP
jgi:NitT/TauT family transport system substrate-binding protein